jgi:hypothetical protein
MFSDSHIRSDLARMRVEELIAQADAHRLSRRGRPPRAARAWRVALVLMFARGLRVEREIEFGVARAPKA